MSAKPRATWTPGGVQTAQRWRRTARVAVRTGRLLVPPPPRPQVWIQGGQRHLGAFRSEAEAGLAYDLAMLKVQRDRVAAGDAAAPAPQGALPANFVLAGPEFDALRRALLAVSALPS